MSARHTRNRSSGFSTSALFFSRDSAPSSLFNLRERVGEIHPGLLHERPRLGLENRVLLPRQPFDLVGPAREFLDQLPGNRSQFKGPVCPPDPVPRLCQIFRQSSIEGRLIERRVPLNVTKLPCFPSGLELIIGRVEHEGVNVVVRVGDAVDRPRHSMGEGRIQ